MKVYVNRRGDVVMLPTTKKEANILLNFKYDLIEDKEVRYELIPFELAKCYLKNLDIVRRNGATVAIDAIDNEWYMYDESGETRMNTYTPSNLEVLFAIYRTLGKHRKIAMLKKRYVKYVEFKYA